MDARVQEIGQELPGLLSPFVQQRHGNRAAPNYPRFIQMLRGGELLDIHVDFGKPDLARRHRINPRAVRSAALFGSMVVSSSGDFVYPVSRILFY